MTVGYEVTCGAENCATPGPGRSEQTRFRSEIHSGYVPDLNPGPRLAGRLYCAPDRISAEDLTRHHGSQFTLILWG